MTEAYKCNSCNNYFDGKARAVEQRVVTKYTLAGERGYLGKNIISEYQSYCNSCFDTKYGGLTG